MFSEPKRSAEKIQAKKPERQGRVATATFWRCQRGMEHITCPACGERNFPTDPQCLRCGNTLLKRPEPFAVLPREETEESIASANSFWETPTGQRRLALLSGAVMVVCTGILLRGVLGAFLVLLAPLLICAGLWELHEWGKERERAKQFEGVRDKETLQAALARHDRPDRVVATRYGPIEVRGFDSTLEP